LKKFIDIVQAIKNPKLFRPLFGDLGTWGAWLVFLKAIFGLPMDSAELAMFRKCTARTEPPRSGVKEAWCLCGRRGGKSRMIATAGSYIGCFHDFRQSLAPGERGMVLNLARDRDQGKIVFGYISAIIESIPALKQMVIRQTADEIDLNNGITIAVKTSDYRAIRGTTIVCCICDEIAFWDAIGTNTDVQILQAIRPAMSTVAESKLLVISSPYAKFGALYEAHRRHYGQDDPNVLVWQADTRTMNPTITQEFIDQEMARDPDAGRSEWLAQFREDIEAAFSLESIEQCIIPGRRELLPAQQVSYVAFVDPSGGRHDQFTVAVAHRSKESAVIDLVRAWKPPFDPSEVTKECAEVLKPYRVRNVTGDAYGGEWPREQFRKHGINYEVSEKNRSQLYLELIPVLNSKRCELPDDRRMIEEFRRLEKRRGRSGKDSIDHPAYGGSDDIANSVAGVIGLVIAKPALSVNAIPIGVGRGLGAEIKKAFGSTFDQPSPFRDMDDEPPAKVHEVFRFRWGWGNDE
jgi:hypothetical protein